MRRRDFIRAVGGAMATWPVASDAQQRTPLIGFLSPSASSVPYFSGLPAGLQELGYFEGRNIRIETRWAHGRLERLPQLAGELIALNVDVLVASLTQAALVASKATTTVPIVMAGVADPVAVGLIASLARPDGNITGTSSLSADIVGKQFELLREILPGVSRVAVLWNPANVAFQKLQLSQADSSAREAGLELRLLEVGTAADLGPAFSVIVREGMRALAVLGDPLFSFHAKAIADLAIRNRVATVSASRAFTEAGILATYGASIYQLHKRAAFYVDRLLKGARPAELPVELPTTFETLINLRTARVLGITVAPALLARADEVIE